NAAVPRRMRIFVVIAVSVMLAVRRHPLQRGPFAGKLPDGGQKPADGLVSREAAVREQTMVAEANADAAREPRHEHEQTERLPREIKRRGTGPEVEHAE